MCPKHMLEYEIFMLRENTVNKPTAAQKQYLRILLDFVHAECPIIHHRSHESMYAQCLIVGPLLNRIQIMRLAT